MNWGTHAVDAQVDRLKEVVGRLLDDLDEKVRQVRRDLEALSRCCDLGEGRRQGGVRDAADQRGRVSVEVPRQSKPP